MGSTLDDPCTLNPPGLDREESMGHTLDELLERCNLVDGPWGQGTPSAHGSGTPSNNGSQSTIFERLQQDVAASSTFITPKVGSVMCD